MVCLNGRLLLLSTVKPRGGSLGRAGAKGHGSGGHGNRETAICIEGGENQSRHNLSILRLPTPFTMATT